MPGLRKGARAGENEAVSDERDAGPGKGSLVSENEAVGGEKEA